MSNHKWWIPVVGIGAAVTEPKGCAVAGVLAAIALATGPVGMAIALLAAVLYGAGRGISNNRAASGYSGTSSGWGCGSILLACVLIYLGLLLLVGIGWLLIHVLLGLWLVLKIAFYVVTSVLIVMMIWYGGLDSFVAKLR